MYQPVVATPRPANRKCQLPPSSVARLCAIRDFWRSIRLNMLPSEGRCTALVQNHGGQRIFLSHFCREGDTSVTGSGYGSYYPQVTCAWAICRLGVAHARCFYICSELWCSLFVLSLQFLLLHILNVNLLLKVN